MKAFSGVTTIRKIGNSKGLLLSKEIVNSLKLEDGQTVEVQLQKDSSILIRPAAKKKASKRPKLNLDRSTWAAQFKAAIEAGHEPEGDMFEGMGTEFDNTEWTWDEE
jgi:antitoxin MazE